VVIFTPSTDSGRKGGVGMIWGKLKDKNQKKAVLPVTKNLTLYRNENMRKNWGRVRRREYHAHQDPAHAVRQWTKEGGRRVGGQVG